MADLPPNRMLLSEVQEGAQAMALLAENEETFRAVVDAFRAQDGESMQMLLARHDLSERCEVVCHWLRSKECVLLCLELSGPPSLDQEPPDVREFAEIVAKVTAEEELVQQIAIALDERDSDAWGAFVEQNDLERFSHLLCHWACTVHYRLVCEIVCQPLVVKRPELVPELQAAGQAIGALLTDKQTFAAAIEAVGDEDCERLGATLKDAASTQQSCHLICEWFCSWRCLLLCLRVCRVFPIEPIESPIEEMLEFARAGGTLASKQGTLERLGAAVLREDLDTVGSLVKEFQFERYCLQFAHWVCFLRCQIFCTCVCPPQTLGIFTKIGMLYYESDISSHAGQSGLTVADQRAFYNTLRLNGGISMVAASPIVEYRFETVPTSPDGTTKSDGTPILPGATPAGSWGPVLPAQIHPTNIGSFIRSTSTFPFFEEIPVWVNRPAAPGIFVITPSADGWIELPPMFPTPPMVPPSLTQWRFVPGGDLLQLDTTTLLPFVALVDETGVVAGSSANAPLQTDVYYGVRMRTRDVGDLSDGSEAGTCEHIAIDNTRYENISHHPYWPGGLFGHTHELAVSSIGIAELAEAPCTDLDTSLTVQFTAAHSNLGDVSVSLEGPGGPYAFKLEPPAAETPGENWYGTAIPSGWSFPELSPCAYLLKLAVDVLLTTGDPGSDPAPLEDYIAFCKGA
jgi:hypothetical protein